MQREVVTRIPTAGVLLDGAVSIPDDPRGLVVFAWGSNEVRRRPEAQLFAHRLTQQRLVTVLPDLLTLPEQRRDELTGRVRSDVSLLAGRLAGALDWLADRPTLPPLAMGLLGSGTGAAAALLAATYRPDGVAVVISYHGRPNLAGGAVSRVKVPTLLIAAEDDATGLEANRQTIDELPGVGELRITPAQQAPTESEDLDLAAGWIADWFLEHLKR